MIEGLLSARANIATNKKTNGVGAIPQVALIANWMCLVMQKTAHSTHGVGLIGTCFLYELRSLHAEFAVYVQCTVPCGYAMCFLHIPCNVVGCSHLYLWMRQLISRES